MTNMRPVYDMLTAASARRSGHMPGHKGGIAPLPGAVRRGGFIRAGHDGTAEHG